MNYSIRHFQSHAEYAELEMLMTRIWGSGTEVASPIAIAIDHHDGCVLGAFENESGRLLGGVMSFLRFSNHPGASRGLALRQVLMPSLWCWLLFVHDVPPFVVADFTPPRPARRRAAPTPGA